MIAEIRKLVAARPFVPFTIHSADGSQLTIPTVDHVAIPPTGRTVFVFRDDGDFEILSFLLISRVTTREG